MEDSNKISQIQQPVNPTTPVVNSSNSKLIPIILGVAATIVIAIGAYALGTKQTQTVVQNTVQTTPIPSPTPQLSNGDSTQPSQGPITVEGYLICLPHRDKADMTEECALGIQTADGKNYALEVKPDDLVSGKFATARHTKVSGIFASKSSYGYDKKKYDIVGTIQVKSFYQ